MTRQRFLLDLLFIGGALALAAGLASAPSPAVEAAAPVADAHHPSFTCSTGMVERP